MASTPVKTNRSDLYLSGTLKSAKLNSTYSSVARLSGLTSPAPVSRPISQDTLVWEKSAREATYICNQAAGLNCCLNKVQQGMTSQLKILQAEHSKGKSADKVGGATEELQYLMTFGSSITQCMAKTMEHLSDFAFVSMYNLTLARRDAYLAHMKSGIKQDTLASLRQAPMDLPTLFPDSILKKAEEDISKFEDKGRSHASSSGCRDTHYHPYKRSDKPSYESKSGKPAWKNLGRSYKKKARIQASKFSSCQAKGQSAYK